jgi:thioredoxin-related protein
LQYVQLFKARTMRNFTLLTFFFLSFGFTRLNAQESVRWYSVAEAEVLMRKEKRKIIVDVYTDWCGWCKQMDRTTFMDPAVVRLINQYYYAVKLDAEQKSDIVFNGKTYKFVASGKGGYNELAAQLLQGNMGYPSIVFLNEDFSLIQSIQGFREAAQLEVIISYFGENGHKNIPWGKYEKSYISKGRR